MASSGAKASRLFTVLGRLEKKVEELAAAHSIERVVAIGIPVRDRELKQIIKLEMLADFLDALSEKTIQPEEGEVPSPNKKSKPKSKPE